MARPKFLPPAAALEEVQRTSANVENAKDAVDVRERDLTLPFSCLDLFSGMLPPENNETCEGRSVDSDQLFPVIPQ